MTRETKAAEVSLRCRLQKQQILLYLGDTGAVPPVAMDF